MNGISSGTLKNEDGNDLFSLLLPPESNSIHVSQNPLQNSSRSGLELTLDSSTTQSKSDDGGNSDLMESSIRTGNVRGSMIKASVILRRAAWNIACRRKLWLGSLLLHAFLAFVVMIVATDISDHINDTTAFFVISTLMLTFLNVQFIFFLHKCNEVFLKVMNYFKLALNFMNHF